MLWLFLNFSFVFKIPFIFPFQTWQLALWTVKQWRHFGHCQLRLLLSLFCCIVSAPFQLHLLSLSRLLSSGIMFLSCLSTFSFPFLFFPFFFFFPRDYFRNELFSPPETALFPFCPLLASVFCFSCTGAAVCSSLPQHGAEWFRDSPLTARPVWRACWRSCPWYCTACNGMHWKLFVQSLKTVECRFYQGSAGSLQLPHPPLPYHLLRVSVSETQRLPWGSMKWQFEALILDRTKVQACRMLCLTPSIYFQMHDRYRFGVPLASVTPFKSWAWQCFMHLSHWLKLTQAFR